MMMNNTTSCHVLALPSSLASSPAFLPSLSCVKFSPISGFCPCFVLDPYHAGFGCSLTTRTKVAHAQSLLMTYIIFLFFFFYFSFHTFSISFENTSFRANKLHLSCSILCSGAKSMAWHMVSAEDCRMKEGAGHHVKCFELQRQQCLCVARSTPHRQVPS